MPRYTPEQLRLRNASIWTKIQIILAPIQFFVFLGGLVITYLYYIDQIHDFYWVTIGVAVKTLFFIILFVTGAFFEKEVFGEWVFSPEFYWEDVGSSIAMGIHFLYFILAIFIHDREVLVWAAFAAYISYLLNALQYLIRIYLEKRNEKRLQAQGLV
ncbi:MAG: 2-vinyl bacteriochlorophyllide hydratase [Chloroherpetonaceae bacterium]|nr:2-vinyl bacteriochlorophyllide hydratase [Chloroherpetonaceae bacterium]